MSAELTYREHVQRFTNHLTALREAIENEDYENADPLCIDTVVRKRIWLGFGGPNVWIDIFLDAERGYAIDGRYEYRWGDVSHTYELSEEEYDEVAELYGLLY